MSIEQVGGKIIRVGGMAKGSGMIHPNMATMLGVSLFWCFLLETNYKHILVVFYNVVFVSGCNH